jgi:hypothetical protein
VKTPTLVSSKKVAIPKGYSDAESARWFHHELLDVCKADLPDVLGIKRPELNVKRSNALELRIGFEYIAILAAAQCGCTSTLRKVNSTVAKALGLKGKGRYLKTQLDTSGIQGYDELPSMVQEAVLVAWSCLT